MSVTTSGPVCVCVWVWVEGWGGLCLGVGGCFLDYSVAARGTPHQTDPVPGEPAGDMPLPELLGTPDTHTQIGCMYLTVKKGREMSLTPYHSLKLQVAAYLFCVLCS